MPKTLVLALSLLAALACSDHDDVGPEPLPAGLAIQGRVVTDQGVPVEGTSVWLRIWDAGQQNSRAEATLITDAAGRFAGTLLTNGALATGSVQADVQPPLGSGLSRASGSGPITFDAHGHADTSGVLFTVSQVAPPVPQGNPSPLNPALLQGAYSGQTVPPETLIGVAYLDLSLTPVADSVYGRYGIDFSASTTCGDGNGDVSGQVRNDTLFLRLVSDSFPGWDGIIKVNTFVATTYTTSADTLILHYPQSSGPCPWGSPAPLRLIRQ